MIEQIPNLPAGTLGFRATGTVTAADYESVLVPDIEAAFAVNRKLRLLYHVAPGFESFQAGAMWDDAKLGFRHFSGPMWPGCGAWPVPCGFSCQRTSGFLPMPTLKRPRRGLPSNRGMVGRNDVNHEACV